ncbi:MAG: phosphoribosylformylglycinamidine synthase [Bacilli bacterium]
MNLDIKRVYVEKRLGFNTEALNILSSLKEDLNIDKLYNLRILSRYTVSNIEEDDFKSSVKAVFSEPNKDIVYYEDVDLKGHVFALEYLPGQYDQKVDFAKQCMQVVIGKEKPIIKHARIFVLEGELSKEDIRKIKKYLINPVDTIEIEIAKPSELDGDYPDALDVETINLINKSKEEIEAYRNEAGLAMSSEDLLFCQKYFKDTEKRNPTITEIKVIDTYWSDHCRHTTFSTVIENIEFEKGTVTEEIKNTFNKYLNVRKFVYKSKKDITLMDLATIGAKELRKSGHLNDLEISEEINACSIIINVEKDGKDEEWLLMFKNETHNHPTEIEPFGGANTCLGGAIRDPLSGRSYVYQAMRISGCADAKQKIEDTLPEKLPQRKITTEAAKGYSSYGNQIGVTTGYVNEIYHPDYVAKRLEAGAVIAAAPRENIKRETPKKGDIVIILGGKTGRDGLGGATASSKKQTEKETKVLVGMEVPKGNPPLERNIQRLFRRKEASILIKKCNDFGAGGVSVAIGELADGLNINLDLVTVKYGGLDGTELAISESQERMAVVVRKEDVKEFNKYAHEENLESTVVAKVTDDRRLKMTWRGKTIFNISRDFLDTNGVKQKINAKIVEPINIDYEKKIENSNLKKMWLKNLKDLNVACQKGLIEMFDSTVGASSVIVPLGGKNQLTPAEGMIAKIPVEHGITNTCSLMAYGFDPYLSKESPYHGAIYAVIHSIAKIVAMGGDYKNIRLSFQEYFERLNKEPERWGKPLSALLGAFKVQHELKIPSIGGKDSMSGTFNDIDVPPSLISFAVAISDVKNIISPEFKDVNNQVILIKIKKDINNIPDFEDIKIKYPSIHEAIKTGKVISAHTVGYGGIAAAISKMVLGNDIGFKAHDNFPLDKEYFYSSYGDIILEINDSFLDLFTDYIKLGKTMNKKEISINDVHISLKEIKNTWIEPLNNVFPVKKDTSGIIDDYSFSVKGTVKPVVTIIKPRVFIPVFPGTNGEYDIQKAFEKAGAKTDLFVFRNLSLQDISDSIKEMSSLIKQSQIIAFPGGPGSGKFIETVFRNQLLIDAVKDLLKNRDGLILGIGDGFHALIKLGLIPFGEITKIKEDYPILTYNKIGRHVSTFVKTKVVSNLSPWLSGCNAYDIHYLPLSHGEGRFVANEKWIGNLKKNGQIATQYVDNDNNPTYDGFYNPTGSMEAVEGITSIDGRIFGKMAHSERLDENIYKNIPGNKDQLIFESAVKYFNN